MVMRFLNTFSGDRWHERNSINMRRRLRSGQFSEGWQYIPESTDIIICRSRFDDTWPACSKWLPDPAFIQIPFYAFETSTAMKKCWISTSLYMRSVIARKNYQRVFV